MRGTDSAEQSEMAYHFRWGDVSVVRFDEIGTIPRNHSKKILKLCQRQKKCAVQ
jgi:hypothetical protein